MSNKHVLYFNHKLLPQLFLFFGLESLTPLLNHLLLHRNLALCYIYKGQYSVTAPTEFRKAYIAQWQAKSYTALNPMLHQVDGFLDNDIVHVKNYDSLKHLMSNLIVLKQHCQVVSRRSHFVRFII